MKSLAAGWHRLITGQTTGPLAAAARAGLRVASWGFAAGVAARTALYDLGVLRSHRLPVPVVSVGNLTVGGSGKTPMVEWVCRYLCELGRRPAVLIRGYRAGPHGSDEAAMLRERLPGVPVIVDPDRVAGGRAAIADHAADVLVLDDGFQHRRLARDLDIVMLPRLPAGADALLPRGLRREPWSALSRAGLCVATGGTRREGGSSSESAQEPRAHAVAVHQPTDLLWLEAGSATPEVRPLATLAGRAVVGFCGIGSPLSFQRTLTELVSAEPASAEPVNVEPASAERVELAAFADHHDFTPTELAELPTRYPSAAVWATTEKDWQRLRWLPSEALRSVLPLAVVRMRLELLSGRAAVETAVKSALAGSSAETLRTGR